MAPLPKPAAPAASSSTPVRALAPFPITACGSHIAPAIVAAAACTQAAPELIAQHLLTLAAMAAQRLISIRLPTGPTLPVSCYFLTVAGSGEGRSAAERVCIDPVRHWQHRFAAQGEGNAPPRGHRRLVSTPINLGVIPEFHALLPEGGMPPRAAKPFEFDEVFLTHRGAGDRYDRYARFGRRSGLFAGVAADVLTPSPARRSEADSLSLLWDGAVVASGVEGAVVAPRLSVHLVTTLSEGLALLRARESVDSGLQGRILAVQPASRIGARVFAESDGASPPAVQALHARLTDLYARAATCETRVIALDEQARREWLAFAHESETALAPDGVFASIRGLAGRLAEHAVRLAAIIALTEDADLSAMTASMLARGIALARFYADEAVRLSNLHGPAAEEKDPLAALQAWLERKHAGQQISLRDVYCFGPVEVRSATLALRAMRQLELLGVTEPIKQDGTKRGGHWRVSTVPASRDVPRTAA